MEGEALRGFITGLFSAKFVTMMLHDVTACAEISQAFSFHICTGSDQLQEAVKTLEQDFMDSFQLRKFVMAP